ncbi:MAG: YfdX family protein [Hyphomicrobiaceae bacterium]
MKRALIAALLGTTMLAAPMVAYATTPATTAKAQQADKAKVDYDKLMKLSEDGFKTMRDVRLSRLAIFNGDTVAAERNINAAVAELEKVKKDDTAYVGRTNAEKDSMQWIPIDASMDIVDNYVDTPQKRAHIAKANEHFKAGDKKKAVDELKLAQIDTNFTRLLMPMTTTADHIKMAQDLMSQKKFYEANLALKAAEDGVVVDTVALVDVPKAAASAKGSNTAATTKPAAASK